MTGGRVTTDAATKILVLFNSAQQVAKVILRPNNGTTKLELANRYE